jgi:hypothetical protein
MVVVIMFVVMMVLRLLHRFPPTLLDIRRSQAVHTKREGKLSTVV